MTLNVYNATSRSGLATTVATELKSRHFKVAKVANDPLKRSIEGTAEVRVGPRGRGAAVTVMAQVPDSVLVLDKRVDTTVDLVIGVAYVALQTPAQVSAALKLAANPTAAPSVEATTPAGCA